MKDKNKTCAKCSKNAEFLLPYLGKGLCKTCFMQLQKQRISRNIKENKLIEDGDKIALAISGGKDSMVMLDFISQYIKYKDVKVKGFYVNRGDAGAEKSIEICKKNCAEKGIDFEVLSFEDNFDFSMKDMEVVAEKFGVNKCSVCGVLRRRILDATARKQGFNKVATGHNLTDESQSFLMNFARGDLNRFSSMGAKSLPKRKGFAQRIKILRRVPEKEIKAYSDYVGIEYNPKPCDCRVGSFRFNFMNHLEDMKKTRPGIEFSIVKIGDEIAELVRGNASKKKVNKCKKCGELTSGEICQVCKYLDAKN